MAFGSNAGSVLFGSPEQSGQLSRFSQGNQGQFDQLISQLLGQLGGNEFSFGPIEDQARMGFEQKTIPSIAERFTSLGAGGGRSSGFNQAVAAAGGDLETNLASQRQQFGLQRQGLMQNLLGLGQQEPFHQPRTPGFLENAGVAGIQGLSGGLSSFLGGRGVASGLRGLAQGGQGSVGGGQGAGGQGFLSSLRGLLGLGA